MFKSFSEIKNFRYKLYSNRKIQNFIKNLNLYELVCGPTPDPALTVYTPADNRKPHSDISHTLRRLRYAMSLRDNSEPLEHSKHWYTIDVMGMWAWDDILDASVEPRRIAKARHLDTCPQHAQQPRRSAQHYTGARDVA